MKYDHDTDDAHRNLFENLQALSAAPPRFDDLAGDEALDLPSLVLNQRFDLEVEGWANRIA